MPFIITSAEAIGLIIGLMAIIMVGVVLVHFIRKHW